MAGGISTNRAHCISGPDAKEGLIFGDFSQDPQSEKFNVENCSRLIRGFKIPEGQTLCVEIEHCGEWEPWGCPGAQCKITRERCRLVIAEPGCYRLVAKEPALGFGSVEALVFDQNKFPNLVQGGCC